MDDYKKSDVRKIQPEFVSDLPVKYVEGYIDHINMLKELFEIEKESICINDYVLNSTDVINECSDRAILSYESNIIELLEDIINNQKNVDLGILINFLFILVEKIPHIAENNCFFVFFNEFRSNFLDCITNSELFNSFLRIFGLFVFNIYYYRYEDIFMDILIEILRFIRTKEIDDDNICNFMELLEKIIQNKIPKHNIMTEILVCLQSIIKKSDQPHLIYSTLPILNVFLARYNQKMKVFDYNIHNTIIFKLNSGIISIDNVHCLRFILHISTISKFEKKIFPQVFDQILENLRSSNEIYQELALDLFCTCDAIFYENNFVEHLLTVLQEVFDGWIIANKKKMYDIYRKHRDLTDQRSLDGFEALFEDFEQ